ncbi:hypothetical protein MTBBW1_950008 [Desulfamplus magnetovallimortis]|uniref:Transposase n=1 Tax=Desulfamplus magnetovallimortis TaxID=1246637 RepID=A0A1W1HL70_9BACT|nr:hypothetical protein MTBBW1_950008 [Desulfamplus magnetovallimortis]
MFHMEFSFLIFLRMYRKLFMSMCQRTWSKFLGITYIADVRHNRIDESLKKNSGDFHMKKFYV